MGVMQREWSNRHQRNRKFFYVLTKIMKIKKNKSKEKETNNDVPSAFFFLASFYNIFVSFFREIKMRCVYVVVMREKERL